jgi:hypothetical protein
MRKPGSLAFNSSNVWLAARDWRVSFPSGERP